MRVANLNSDNTTITKKIVNNGGKNMQHVVKILPNHIKDISLAPLGRHKIDIA